MRCSPDLVWKGSHHVATTHLDQYGFSDRHLAGRSVGGPGRRPLG
jgi:hypothetical protein